MALRIPDPPSQVTGPLRIWLNELVRTLNSQVANVSYFSGTSPESVITGVAGDWAIQVGSVSTNTRIFVKAGDVAVPSKTSWMKVTVAIP